MRERDRRTRALSGLPRSRADIEREQSEEIEQHLQARTVELISSGVTPTAARKQAEREFGDVVRARAELTRADERTYRVQRRSLWLTDLGLDLRYALRSLRRSPGFALVVLLTLTLGMGATTSIFSVFNAYLLRPLSFPHADRLVLVSDTQPNYGYAPASYGEFTDWTELEGPFDEIAALWRRNRTYEGEYPERVRVALVSDGFFELTAPRVLVGRWFTADEQEEGAPPAVVVLESFWRSRLGADRGVVGRSVRLDGSAITVVGVITDLPSLWSGDPIVAVQPLAPNAPWRDRGSHYLAVWARLRPGVTVEQAQQRLAAPIAALQQERDTDHGIGVTPLRTLLIGETRPLFIIMMVTVTLVLIIACTNVANLMLARAARRDHEFALRAALGAGRARLMRQLLAEALVLATLGAAAGLIVGTLGARVLLRALPESMPRPPLVTLDARVLGVVALTILGTTLLFGMTPLLVELRATLSALLRSGRGDVTSAPRGKRARHGLVVLELALSMMLLAGASLMVRSFARLMQVDPGVDTNRVIAFHLNLLPARYDTPERRAQFFGQLQERLTRLPGVQQVGAAANLPLAGGGMSGDFYIEGTSRDVVRTQPSAEKRIVTPEYFHALGVRLLSGRYFTADDRVGRPRVVIINETMARALWPNENPIGRRINSLSPQDEWEEIVGVVSDVRALGLDRAPPLEILYPYDQHAAGGMVLIVRTAGDVASLVPQLRRVVAALDPQQPIYNIRVMDDIVAQTVAGRRLLMLLSTGFGLLALVLAAIGTAGIIAYAVARRTREIGVRLALGARPGAVLAMVIGEAMSLAVLGVLIGLAGALVLGEALRSHLFEIAPTDGPAFLAAVMMLFGAAALASYLPARRVLRIDPLSAIRVD